MTFADYFHGILTLIFKPSFSQGPSLHRHLSFAQAYLRQFDHLVFLLLVSY